MVRFNGIDVHIALGVCCAACTIDDDANIYITAPEFMFLFRETSHAKAHTHGSTHIKYVRTYCKEAYRAPDMCAFL